MMLGYIEYYLVNEDPLYPEELEPGSAPSRGSGQGTRGITFDRLLLRFDANKDGTISEDEVPENLLPQFRRSDRTSNGVLERDDFAP